MKRTIALALALLLHLSSVWADPYDDALAAIERGDYATAIGMLRTLAESGNHGAQATLALVYDTGYAVERNEGEAVKWYRLAAAGGDKSAQYNLAGMYDIGQGVPQDNVKAYMWYDLSIASGNPDAAAERAAVAAKMTPQQIAEAKKLAAACLQDKPKLCD